MSDVAAPPRVAVTGGLGFIGGHLCRSLTRRGYDVVAIDRRAGSRASPPMAGGARAIRADLSADPLEPLLEEVEAVVHLAALPGPRTRRPLPELWRHNVRATQRLVAALGPGRRLVFASTSSIYGDAARLPTPEDSPACPLNPYAVTKLAAERRLLAAARGGGDVVVCRLFTVFGPGQRADMAFWRWIAAIHGGARIPWCAQPGARREFTYVGDAVRGLVAALERGRPGRAYNLAGTGSVSVRAALAEIESAIGRRARLAVRRPLSEALITSACGKRALAELGYAPSVGLRAGIERQVEAMLGAPSGVPAAAAAA